MNWEAAEWSVGLHERPIVLQIGVGFHHPRTVEWYRLPELWCVHLYRYRATLVLDGEEFPIRPGYASIIPPGAAMEYRFSADQPVHLFAHFLIPDAPGPRIMIRAMQDLGDRFDACYRAFEEAIGYFPHQPRRAEVRIWDMLWQLADPRRVQSDSAPMRSGAAVRSARQIIEQRLGQRLRVAKLAQEVGLSHNHFTRLFRAAVGTTVARYIQDRRMLRAEHLLVYSTLPIKAIAAEVGIGDPHLFNKTVRRRLGRAPREIRAAGR